MTRDTTLSFLGGMLTGAVIAVGGITAGFIVGGF
jgi:hypothetical protein